MATKANILLMDEDLPMRQTLRRARTAENSHVMSAASGHEALRRFGETQIEVLLLGLNGRNDSDWDTVLGLTALQPLLPVIITTARPGHPTTEKARAADAWMEKPFDNRPVLRQASHKLTSQKPDVRRRNVNERPASTGNSLLHL